MYKEKASIEAEQSQIYSSVKDLLNDPYTINLIRQYRDNPTALNRNNDANPIFVERTENIYLAFEPRALRIINHKMLQFPYMSSEEREDATCSQKLSLYQFIYRFHWENFAGTEGAVDHAIGAFTSYINKATGSPFVKDVIKRQKEVSISSPRIQKDLNPIWRPVEDEIVNAEFSEDLLVAIESLKDRVSIINLTTMLRKALGESTKEIALEAGVNVKSINERVRIAKYALMEILQEKGLLNSDNYFLAKDVTYFRSGKTEIFEARREILQQKYYSFQDLLPQKALYAAKLFYGLDGAEPLYDYKKVAEVANISLTNASVSVSRVTRLMLGIDEFPPEAIEKRAKKDLYNYWLSHRDNIAISLHESQVLDLYFAEGVSFSEIAHRFGYHPETARRRLLRALDRIEISIS